MVPTTGLAVEKISLACLAFCWLRGAPGHGSLSVHLLSSRILALFFFRFSSRAFYYLVISVVCQDSLSVSCLDARDRSSVFLVSMNVSPLLSFPISTIWLVLRTVGLCVEVFDLLHLSDFRFRCMFFF